MDYSIYWIVGGEYRSFTFTDLVPGTGRLMGPFADKINAERAWRQVSEEHRSQCLVRFTIATERGKFTNSSDSSRAAP